MKCYEECRVEFHDLVVQYDAQQIQIQSRDNMIVELKKVKGELEETLEKNETFCHHWGAHLATTYRHVLERYGAETQEFKITDNIASYCLWMNSELKLLPDIMSKVGDYGVVTWSEAIFQLLERQGCELFKTFGAQGFEFTSSEDMPAPIKTVDLITKIILCNFWMNSGREYARKKAVDRLTKVRPFILFA
jgi:hypothetical protein